MKKARRTRRRRRTRNRDQEERGKLPFFGHAVSEKQGQQSFFSPTSVQTKMKVNEPGDKMEQEADAVADQVVATPKDGIQRAIIKEEEGKLQRQENMEEEEQLQLQEEEEEVQAKPQANTAPSVSSHTANQIKAEKGRGSTLPANVQTEMESSFGADFSKVNIHTDDRSAELNKSLKARAFTHKNDIFFNKGEYQPESSKGKHLLAHELTHTLQQGASKRVSRVDEDFTVTGKYEGAAGDPDAVYYEYGSTTPDVDEMSKVRSKASDTNKNFVLYGYASEEGGDSANETTAGRRMNTVKRLMGEEGHLGERRTQNRHQFGQGKLDYRRMRKVEIIEVGGSSSEQSCEADPVMNPAPEVESCGTSFTAAHPVALNMVIGAFTRMALGLNSIAFPELRREINNAVGTIFGDAGHYNTVFNHLGNLIGQVAAQPATVRCHNYCDSGCENADAYMDGTTGASAVLTLCPPYINGGNVRYNAETLVHEALHATPGLGTVDYAYRSERGITQLDSATALQNTDSFVGLILELLNPGTIVGGGGSARDNIDASIIGQERTDMVRVMAYLEKWLIEPTAEISSLYDIIQEAIEEDSWMDISYPYYLDTLSFMSPLFGLTLPMDIPTIADQVAVAGIYDRLLPMDELMWETNLDIIRDDARGTDLQTGPSDPIFVTGSFLSSGQHAMAYNLLARIVANNPRISEGQRGNYNILIEKIRDHAGHDAP